MGSHVPAGRLGVVLGARHVPDLPREPERAEDARRRDRAGDAQPGWRGRRAGTGRVTGLRPGQVGLRLSHQGARQPDPARQVHGGQARLHTFRGRGRGSAAGQEAPRRPAPVRAGRQAVRHHRRVAARRARAGPHVVGGQDPEVQPGRQRSLRQPVPRQRHLQLRPPQPAGARVRLTWPVVGRRVRSLRVRRAEPDQARRQLRLAVLRGRVRPTGQPIHGPGPHVPHVRRVTGRAHHRRRCPLLRRGPRSPAVPAADHRRHDRRAGDVLPRPPRQVAHGRGHTVREHLDHQHRW